MTTEDLVVKPTSFINFYVTVIPDHNNPSQYLGTCIPEEIKVTSPDTVMNFQLIPPTPDYIEFSKVTHTPVGKNQFSDFIISVGGKQLTLINANTVACTFQLLLQVKNTNLLPARILEVTDIDPQVINQPPQ